LEAEMAGKNSLGCFAVKFFCCTQPNIFKVAGLQSKLVFVKAALLRRLAT
jgi:hypothetical protein